LNSGLDVYKLLGKQVEMMDGNTAPAYIAYALSEVLKLSNIYGGTERG